jgi:hypothetical protein
METTALLLTVVLSAVAAGSASYSLNFSRDKLYFRRMKAEELYAAVEKLDHELTQFFEQSYSLYNNWAQSSAEKADPLANSPFASVHMLTRFYFPSLSPSLHRAFGAAETASQCLTNWRSASELDAENLLLLLDGAVSELKHAFHDFKRAIIGHQAKGSGLASMLGFKAAFG